MNHTALKKSTIFATLIIIFYKNYYAVALERACVSDCREYTADACGFQIALPHKMAHARCTPVAYAHCV